MKMYGKQMHFNIINRIKFWGKYLGIICFWGGLGVSNLIFAQDNQKLTQAQYDERIGYYTQEVNATKKILDEAEHVDAAAQKHAFCNRIHAYQQIAEISKNNLQLDTANMMLLISQQFLERQKQSLTDSGMTEKVFCAAVKDRMAENDIKMAENDN